jgi:hypothetical protein
MQSFLDFERTERLKYFPNRGRWLDLLARDNAEQEIIQNWCKSTMIPKKFEGQSTLADILNFHEKPLEVAPCEEWEARLIFLADWFTDFQALTEWEIAPMKKRSRSAQRVARLARDLASALEETLRPYYPTALELFDEEQALDIIRALPEQTAKALLACTGYSIDWQRGCQRTDFDLGYYRSSAASNLASRFSYPEAQRLPSMLRRLADTTEKQIKEPKRDLRAKTNHANSRVFARYLADHFLRQYNHTPDEVIAACVSLKFPYLDSPPTKDTIRDWRGAK